MASLTIEQLAAETSVSVRTLRRQVAEGMPSERFGRARRFDLAAVKAWAARRAEGRRPLVARRRTP